jgi:hypothetical protein
MAYLAPEFEHDVFVSYSHGDPNGTGDAPLKRWTHEFIRELKSEIHSVETEFDTLNVWIDENIDPTRHLTDELRRVVRASGILLIVMSPRYLASSWCGDEREWFKEQFQDRARDQGRVFIIQALPTDHTSWPEFFCDERGHPLIGFPFYDPKTNRPFGWRDIREGGEEFAKRLGQLETKLTVRLRELRGRTQNEAILQKPIFAIKGATKRVYLHARAEYASLRDRLRGELAEDGMTPLVQSATGGRALKETVGEERSRFEAVKRCGAMALVRADDNDDFLSDLYDIGVDERERIEYARGAALPCAVLDGSGRELPNFDCSAWGMRRFDLRNQDWRGEFQKWMISTQNAATA